MAADLVAAQLCPCRSYARGLNEDPGRWARPRRGEGVVADPGVAAGYGYASRKAAEGVCADRYRGGVADGNVAARGGGRRILVEVVVERRYRPVDLQRLKVGANREAVDRTGAAAVDRYRGVGI